MIPFEAWNIFLLLGASLFILLLLLFLTPYLPLPAFEVLVKIIGKLPGVKWAVVFIDPLQRRYSSKLAEDVSIKQEADISVSRHLRSNPGHVKTISTLRVQFDIENRSPVDITPEGAQIHMGFVSGGIPFKTLHWNPDISPRPPSGFEVKVVPAKGDGRFTIEFLPPIFLYYTREDRPRVGRTLYFYGWISIETGFGNTPITFTAEAPISEKQVKHDFREAKEEFEEGFNLFQESSDR